MPCRLCLDVHLFNALICRCGRGSVDEWMPLTIGAVFDWGMTDPVEPTLTLDQAYRATYHFIHQYYLREPIEPFLLMLASMGPWNVDSPLRQTGDPATWDDWMESVRAALASDELPPLGDVKYVPKS